MEKECMSQQIEITFSTEKKHRDNIYTQGIIKIRTKYIPYKAQL